MRTAALAVFLAAALTGCAVHAQSTPEAPLGDEVSAPATVRAPPQEPEPLGTVLLDLDGDRVPDRLGEAVVVSGRATIDAGALGLRATTTLASGEHAIWLRNIPAPQVRAGDSLVVRGTLGFWNGLAVIDAPTIRRIQTAPRVPTAAPVRSGDLEAEEGRLVEIEGIVVGVSDVASGGQALMLALDDRSIVTAFVFSNRPAPLDLSAFEAGDRLRVTGLAGQFDRLAPYDATYQIYPRTLSDIKRGGLSARAYRWMAAGALALLVAALFWAWLLRAEVSRRIAEVRRSETHYRAIFRSASDAVYVYDMLGTGVEANAAARRAFGIGEDAPVPSLFDVVDPAFYDRVEAHLVVLRATGHDRCDLGLHTAASGDGAVGIARPFEFESQVIEVDGEDRVLSLARDVSVRRAYEAELIDARRAAEEMARLKSALLANMSHEIRTPLTAVIGYAEILREEVEPEQQELTRIIEQGGRRLLRTLNSVLDLARLDSGTETLYPRPIDLADHVQQSVALVRSLAESKGLSLHCSSPEGGIAAILDPDAVDRIVTNLVGNAIKFTERGEVRVTVEAAGADAVLTVSDTGIGINEAFLPDLFSEFRQESEGDGRSHEGTGLGLAITRRLVDLMGGRIEVESEKGSGTTFTVHLLRLSQDAIAPSTAFPPEATVSVSTVA